MGGRPDTERQRAVSNVCCLRLRRTSNSRPTSRASLPGTEEKTKAREQPSPGFLLLKAVAANALGFLLAGLGQHEEAVRWLDTAVDLAETAEDEDSAIDSAAILREPRDAG